MKLAIVAALAALLVTPVLAQSPAVQGRNGSTAGGYLTDQPSSATGGFVDDGPTTGSIGVGPERGMAVDGRSGAIDPEAETIIVVPQGSDGPVSLRR